MKTKKNLLNLQYASANDLNSMESMILSCGYDQFRYYPARSKDLYKKYVIYRLTKDLENNKGKAIFVTLDGNPVGFIVMKEFKGGTAHFGFKMGVIDYLISIKTSYEKELAIKAKLLEACAKWCKLFESKSSREGIC